jgi:hypothetical protein
LARGAEIPDRESRVQDFAECHAGYRVRRVTEIWMVEKVKDFSTELQVEPFGYLRVFHYREIGVYEVGPRKRLLSVAVQRHGARDRGARNQASENGRFVLIPISDETHGHGTHTWAAVWQQYLKELLETSQRQAGSD